MDTKDSERNHCTDIRHNWPDSLGILPGQLKIHTCPSCGFVWYAAMNFYADNPFAKKEPKTVVEIVYKTEQDGSRKAIRVFKINNPETIHEAIGGGKEYKYLQVLDGKPVVPFKDDELFFVEE